VKPLNGFLCFSRFREVQLDKKVVFDEVYPFKKALRKPF
jgi:hypothetical protein